MFSYFLFYGVSRMKKELFSRRFIILVLCFVLVAAGLFGVFFHISSNELTLQQAQAYSQSTGLSFFVYHARSGHYSPLRVPLVPNASTSTSSRFRQQVSTLLVDEENARNGSRSDAALLSPSAGDKLVYLSTTQSAPDAVSIYPVTESGLTLPVLFQASSNTSDSLSALVLPTSYSSLYSVGHTRSFHDYDAQSGPELSSLSAQAGPITINGLSLDEYAASCTLRQAVSASDFAPAQSIVTLSDSAAPVTVEYSSGTVYHTFQLKPSCRWLGFSPDTFSSCHAELTQDGYAQLDLSDFVQTPGLYVIRPSSSSPVYLVFELTD